jgi:putative protease
MRLITFIESVHELNQFLETKNDSLSYELILGCTELSRYSKTTREEILELISLAGKNKLPVVLEWDALNQEERFLEACAVVDRLPLHDVKAIRVQDPGAIEYVKTKYPWLKMQVVLENGNHNLVGLRKWSEYLGEQCERLVLSNELSKEMLREYAKVLTTPIEVQAFGRILLFYSPRLLLSPLEKESMTKSWIETSGSSEESPHTGFPLIENRHGTFMFNVKDLYLLDHLNELSEMGIQNARVDLRFDQNFSNYLPQMIALFSGKKTESELEMKKNHVRPLIKGFYNINKTDVLFTKLKNKRTQRVDENYLGEVVDVERDFQLALMIKVDGPADLSQYDLKMVTPEGKDKVLSPQWMKTSLGEEVKSGKKNDLILIPYANGITVKTQIYLQKKP